MCVFFRMLGKSSVAWPTRWCSSSPTPGPGSWPGVHLGQLTGAPRWPPCRPNMRTRLPNREYTTSPNKPCNTIPLISRESRGTQKQAIRCPRRFGPSEGSRDAWLQFGSTPCTAGPCARISGAWGGAAHPRPRNTGREIVQNRRNLAQHGRAQWSCTCGCCHTAR